MCLWCSSMAVSTVGRLPPRVPMSVSVAVVSVDRTVESAAVSGALGDSCPRLPPTATTAAAIDTDTRGDIQSTIDTAVGCTELRPCAPPAGALPTAIVYHHHHLQRHRHQHMWRQPIHCRHCGRLSRAASKCSADWQHSRLPSTGITTTATDINTRGDINPLSTLRSVEQSCVQMLRRLEHSRLPSTATTDTSTGTDTRGGSRSTIDTAVGSAELCPDAPPTGSTLHCHRLPPLTPSPTPTHVTAAKPLSTLRSVE